MYKNYALLDKKYCYILLYINIIRFKIKIISKIITYYLD